MSLYSITTNISLAKLEAFAWVIKSQAFSLFVLRLPFSSASIASSPPSQVLTSSRYISLSVLPPQEVRRTFIPMWILIQILLMILLRIKPLERTRPNPLPTTIIARTPFFLPNNLGHNLLPPIPRLLNLLCHPSSDLGLFWRVCKDCGTVLGTTVRTLGVEGCGVVHPVEEFAEDGVVDCRGGCVFES